jgi:Alr-MurF fusion protein
VFIALTTQRNDGHQYILPLLKKGVTHFIVSHIPIECKQFENEVTFSVVSNTLSALQELATYHRKQFKLPIIGITGSNGKTIVKEWLYQLLKTDYSIVRSPKSFNSQVGVPLSVWQINAKHSLGIFEAGISESNEMPVLNDIIKPTLGVFTSFGAAHDEGFKNKEEKFTEKLKLFTNCESIVINALNLTTELINKIPNDSFVISKSEHANLQITNIELFSDTSVVKARYHNNECKIKILYTDAASIDNAITCWAVLLKLHIPQAEIEKRMLLLQPVAMRLELKLGNDNCVLINDFYNSDINALEIALHYQKQQHRGGKKIVVLSDIEQSGKLNWELYKHVADLMKQFEIDLLVGIGKEISSQKELFNNSFLFYQSTSDYLVDVAKNQALQFHTSIILLKGARSFEFERISKVYQQKSHDTILEINLNKLTHNLNFYRAQVDKKTKIMCMVKATGYGSGSTEIAFTLQHHHIDYLAVAYTDEGVDLRKAGVHLPIMVMSPEESSYDDMIDYQLEPEIYSFKVAHEFLQALQNKAISQPYPVHIKFDTGMHRLGFELSDLDELCALLKHETGLLVKTCFSHLVASDDNTFDEFTKTQIINFETCTQQVEKTIGYTTIKHICNSGAITRFKQAHYDMVRLGIGMYGVGFNAIEKQNLQNISSLKTKISQIKKVKQGDTIGYNRKGIISTQTQIATIPIGYADGFNRNLGNGNGVVYINDVACKTIGNICMDMCMIDVSHIVCSEGDEVIIFESNEQLMNLSASMSTIPYEVLTSISSRVKRIYVQE